VLIGPRTCIRKRGSFASASAAAALVLAMAGPQAAAQSTSGPWRGFVEGANAHNAQALRIGGSLDWPSSWKLGPVRIAGYTEVTIGRWRLEPDARLDRAYFTQVGVTPVVRFYGGETEGLFFEAGIGANVIAPKYHSKHREQGSTFNFGDHVGLGWRSSGPAAWEATLRFEHFSNAGIREPNPGKNWTELRLGAAF